MTLPSLVAPRPTSVSIAVAIGWVSVVLDLISGVSLYLLAGNADLQNALGTDAATTRTSAIGTLIGGIVLAVVVALLSKGSSISRALVSVVMLLRIGLAAWTLFAFGSHHLTEALLTIVVGAFALGLLWNRKANDFFATNRA